MMLIPEVERTLGDAVRRDVLRASTRHKRRGLCSYTADIGRRGRPLAVIALLVVGGAAGAVTAAGSSRVPAPVPPSSVATRPVPRAQTPAPDSATTPAPRAEPIAPERSATTPAPRAEPIAPERSATTPTPRAEPIAPEALRRGRRPAQSRSRPGALRGGRRLAQSRAALPRGPRLRPRPALPDHRTTTQRL